MTDIRCGCSCNFDIVLKAWGEGGGEGKTGHLLLYLHSSQRFLYAGLLCYSLLRLL